MLSINTSPRVTLLLNMEPEFEPRQKTPGFMFSLTTVSYGNIFSPFSITNTTTIPCIYVVLTHINCLHSQQHWDVNIHHFAENKPGEAETLRWDSNLLLLTL